MFGLKAITVVSNYSVAFCDVTPYSLVSYKTCCLEILMSTSQLCCRSYTQ